ASRAPCVADAAALFVFNHKTAYRVETPLQFTRVLFPTQPLAGGPRVRQSGTCLRSTAPVGTEGNRHLRRVLFMAALTARRHNPRSEERRVGKECITRVSPENKKINKRI